MRKREREVKESPKGFGISSQKDGDITTCKTHAKEQEVLASVEQEF